MSGGGAVRSGVAQLSRVLLLTRDVSSSVKFYGAEGIGLLPKFVTEEYAEFHASDTVALALQHAERESDCSTGYSPLLQFNVEDMDMMVSKLIMQGASLDGPIKYPIYGKIASMRAPDGHMVGLFEPNAEVPEEEIS